MSIRKLASGRWFAELKAGRTYVTGKAFDTKREAQAWYSRERAALVGGVDPRAGRATVRELVPRLAGGTAALGVGQDVRRRCRAPPAHPDRTRCAQGGSRD